MKRIIVFLLCVCLAISLVSCSINRTKSEILGAQKVKETFSNCPHPDDVLADCGKIDFDLRPDFKGLKKKTVKDEENSTSTDNWYDSRGNLKYSDYRNGGFGEDSFDYYTKSKSGKALTLTYCLNEGETYWVKATADTYSVHFNDIGEDGADDIYIEEYKPGGWEYVSYNKSESGWVTGYAVFFGDEGLIQYYGYSEEDDYITDTLAKKVNDIKVSDFSEKLYYAAPAQCSARSCKISYTENSDGREWYLTAPFIYQFDSVEQANRFSKEFGLPEPEYSPLDGETLQIDTGEYTFRVSLDFAQSEEFSGFVKNEINDDYSIVLKLNDDKEITGFETGFIQFY